MPQRSGALRYSLPFRQPTETAADARAAARVPLTSTWWVRARTARVGNHTEACIAADAQRAVFYEKTKQVNCIKV